MAIAFFVMSILSIPSMIINSKGTGVLVNDRDFIGLYKLSLGNFGYNKDDTNYKTESHCASNAYGYTTNSTCITFFGNHITTLIAGEIITAMEFLQILVFFAAILYLYWKTEKLTHLTEGRDCVVSDFSIMVRDLPRNTTEEEIVNHFSTLYQLERKDWKHRPPLFGAQVVQLSLIHI